MNNSGAERVFKFLRSGKLFRGGSAPAFDVAIERDFERALRLADGWAEVEAIFWEQGLEVPDDYMIWMDVLHAESAIFKAHINKENCLPREAWDRYFDTITDEVTTHLPQEFVAAREFVIGELMVCIESLSSPHPSPFYEKLLRIYESGYWACGWEGEHPQGRFIVFQP